MSLAIIYKGTLVADRCSVLFEPNSLGQKTMVTKLHVAKDKTFAFANVGPTLSVEQQNVLETIIRESFQKAKGELEIVPLGHGKWIRSIENFSFYLITKKSIYSYNRRDTRAFDKDAPLMIKDDGVSPLVGGTGMFVAAMAAVEGVPMKDICCFVSTITATVSYEGDMITQRELKAMKL